MSSLSSTANYEVYRDSKKKKLETFETSKNVLFTNNSYIG